MTKFTVNQFENEKIFINMLGLLNTVTKVATGCQRTTKDTSMFFSKNRFVFQFSARSPRMEDIYDVNDSSDNATVEITPTHSNSAVRRVMVRDYSEKRQEPYTSRDRKLLLNLIAEYDTENMLFSAKRDVDTCQQKHE